MLYECPSKTKTDGGAMYPEECYILKGIVFKDDNGSRTLEELLGQIQATPAPDSGDADKCYYNPPRADDVDDDPIIFP